LKSSDVTNKRKPKENRFTNFEANAVKNASGPNARQPEITFVAEQAGRKLRVGKTFWEEKTLPSSVLPGHDRSPKYAQGPNPIVYVQAAISPPWWINFRHYPESSLKFNDEVDAKSISYKNGMFTSRALMPAVGSTKLFKEQFACTVLLQVCVKRNATKYEWCLSPHILDKINVSKELNEEKILVPPSAILGAYENSLTQRDSIAISTPLWD